MSDVVYRQKRRDKSGNVRFVSSIVRRTPTQEELKSRLHYDPETGIFTHLVNRGKGKVGTIAGNPSGHGYWEIRICNRLFPAHRLAWLYMTGELPVAPLSVDHINGVRADNRWANLRLATYEQQTWNSPAQHHCKSGLKGAWPCQSTGRWQSIIQTGKKKKFLGRFDTALEAHEAWLDAAIRIRGPEWVKRAKAA